MALPTTALGREPSTALPTTALCHEPSEQKESPDATPHSGEIGAAHNGAPCGIRSAAAAAP